MVKSSIIIPVFNTEMYLKECLNSLLNQTQKEIEIILVDDGSTDKSGRLIDEYSYKYKNIIAIHQSNQKLGAARNAGLKVAKGEYVYFLDSDDTIEVDLLEKCYELSKKNQLDFLMFDAKPFIDDGMEIQNFDFENNYNRTNLGIEEILYTGKKFWKQYYFLGGVYVNAVLVYSSRQFLLKNKLLFLKGIYYEDNDWTLRMFLKSKRVMYLPYRGYNRRYRSGSITTGNYNLIHLNSCMKILEYLRNWYGFEADIQGKQMISQIFITITNRLESIMIYMINNEKDYLIDDSMQSFVKLGYNCLVNKLPMSMEMRFYLEKYFSNIRDELVKSKVVTPYSQILSNIKQLWIEDVAKHYKLQQRLKIGIYGIGKVCDELLDWYHDNGISINAKLTFITSVFSSQLYKGHCIVEVNEVMNLNLDYIIIASTKYKDEMLKNLKKNGIDIKKIILSYVF